MKHIATEQHQFNGHTFWRAWFNVFDSIEGTLRTRHIDAPTEAEAIATARYLMQEG